LIYKYNPIYRKSSISSQGSKQRKELKLKKPKIKWNYKPTGRRIRGMFRITGMTV
jgi:hypothetical protein